MPTPSSVGSSPIPTPGSPRTRRRRAPRCSRSCRRRPCSPGPPSRSGRRRRRRRSLSHGRFRPAPAWRVGGRRRRGPAARAAARARRAGGGAEGARLPCWSGGGAEPEPRQHVGRAGRRGLAAQLGGQDGPERLHVGGALQALGQQRAEVLAAAPALPPSSAAANVLTPFALPRSVNTTLPGRGDAARAHDGDGEPALLDAAGDGHARRRGLHLHALDAAGDGDGHLAFGRYRHREALGRLRGWSGYEQYGQCQESRGGERGACRRRYGRPRGRASGGSLVGCRGTSIRCNR